MQSNHPRFALGTGRQLKYQQQAAVQNGGASGTDPCIATTRQTQGAKCHRKPNQLEMILGTRLGPQSW